MVMIVLVCKIAKELRRMIRWREGPLEWQGGSLKCLLKNLRNPVLKLDEKISTNLRHSQNEVSQEGG